MKLNRLVQIFVPPDDKFYNYFERATGNLVKASQLLKRIPTESEATRHTIVRQIQDLEHNGDAVTHEIFSELNRTFITPFDREDIHTLTSAVDDVLDFLNGAATRIVLYKVREFPPSTMQLMNILDSSIGELHRGVAMIRDLAHPEQLRQILKKVNEYENEADAVFEYAVADLFEREQNPMTVIKLKEIYVALETATDKCEDAANVLEAILIKHA